MGRGKAVKEGIMNVNLDLCDCLLHDYLIDKAIPLEDKVRTFMPLIVKKIPTKLEAHGDAFRTVIINYADTIRREGNPSPATRVQQLIASESA